MKALSYCSLLLLSCAKINFDLSTISEQGLVGQADGLRAFSYEFCIPANLENVQEVQSLDPSLEIFPRSRGRVRCQKDKEYLCIGNTHQPNWKEILLKLAELNYVKTIEPFYGE